MSQLRGPDGAGGVLLPPHDRHLLAVLDGRVASLDPDEFLAVLPLLRRTFGEFAAPEHAAIGRAVSGALNRAARTRRPRPRDIDWNRRIATSLARTCRSHRTVIPERLVGRTARTWRCGTRASRGSDLPGRPHSATGRCEDAPLPVARWLARKAQGLASGRMSIYDSIGGAATVRAAVDDFYVRVLADPDGPRASSVWARVADARCPSVPTDTQPAFAVMS